MDENEDEENSNGSILVELPIHQAPMNTPFDLENTVCSHGLFMMAPNKWDPISRSLSRPLRLTDHHSPPPLTAAIRISQPTPSTLHLLVHSTRTLSPHHHSSLVNQVTRMLKLSENENRKIMEFRNIVEALYGDEEETKECLRSFSGRVFRSPTLFEDMVKCILLCNCQFSRTLSMAEALCELQFEIENQYSSVKYADIAEDDFTPKTPAKKELKRKWEMPQVWMLRSNSADAEPDSESEYQPSQEMGSFPSPEELANLDESFLAKRCNLGYRASRILKLARRVVQGSIQLTELEEDCEGRSLSNYDKIAEQLRQIDGFGPFTCANVLMCMGFYHLIPSDSETIRHLKQVHGIKSTIQTVQRDVEVMYEKYAPFQFLEYWAELWHFYEQRFGKLSELPYSDYKLITAANMKKKQLKKSKKS